MFSNNTQTCSRMFSEAIQTITCIIFIIIITIATIVLSSSLSSSSSVLSSSSLSSSSSPPCHSNCHSTPPTTFSLNSINNIVKITIIVYIIISPTSSHYHLIIKISLCRQNIICIIKKSICIIKISSVSSNYHLYN